MDLAAALRHRRRLVGASATRRKAPRLPAPVPPSGAIVAYTRELRDVVDAVHGVTVDVLREEGLVPHDERADGRPVRADAEGAVPYLPPQPPLPGVPMGQINRVTTRMLQRLAEMLRRRPMLAAVDHVAVVTAAHSRREWSRVVKAALGVDLPSSEPDLVPAMDAFRRENTDLITSLVQSHVDRVREVLRDAGSGTRVEEIARSIRESTDATRSKASLIARDQVLKLNANVTQRRHEAAGVTEYVWRTSRDERVREDHRVLDGTRQRYDHPPVVDRRRGERANPGTYYQCRCTAEPIIPGFDDAPEPALAPAPAPAVTARPERARRIPAEEPDDGPVLVDPGEGWGRAGPPRSPGDRPRRR